MRTLYWLCTLNKDKEALLQEIVKCQNIRNRHQNETNKEIQAYLRAQGDMAEEKKLQLRHALREAQANSEIIFRGSPQQVNADTYKTVALKGIAEKVFEKYPLASANMKSDCVNKLASYGDVTTIPDSLNPFKIIKKNDGTIDAAHPALMEIKDFVASRSEATGQELMTHFESIPYGWAKDTIRYLVALMLKAGSIQLRVSGKDITVFGESAVAAMGNNNAFGKISISLNTDGTLTVPELLNAAKILMGVLGAPRTAPVKDQIAQAANKRIKYLMTKWNKLVPHFEHLHLAGLHPLNQAIGYANRILESEGGEAAYLLGKDKECEKTFRYAMELVKCNEQAGFLDRFLHMEKLMDEADNLAPNGILDGFRKQVNEVRQVYNGYVANPDLPNIVSDITELSSQLDAYLQQACLEFQTQSNEQLNKKRVAILANPEMEKLKEEQRAQIETLLGELTIESRGSSIDNLRDMLNKFSGFYMPMGAVEVIEGRVKTMAAANAPAVTTVMSSTAGENTEGNDDNPGKGTPTHLHSPSYSSTQLCIKHKITSRAELQEVIDRLTQLLDKVGDNSPVEFVF